MKKNKIINDNDLNDENQIARLKSDKDYFKKKTMLCENNKSYSLITASAGVILACACLFFNTIPLMLNLGLGFAGITLLSLVASIIFHFEKTKFNLKLKNVEQELKIANDKLQENILVCNDYNKNIFGEDEINGKVIVKNSLTTKNSKTKDNEMIR